MKPSKSSNVGARFTVDRTGAAMIEMVLALPLLFVVLALIYFMGTRMMWVQRDEMMARYETWRAVHHGPSPSIQNSVDALELNEAFHHNLADYVNVDAHHRPANYETMDDLVALAQQEPNEQLGDYLQEIVDTWPGNVRLRFTSEHEPENEYFSQFGSSVTRAHTRIAQPWWQYWPGLVQYQDGGAPMNHGVSPESLIRDYFFEDFDDTLNNSIRGDNDWAQSIRNFYVRRPGYAGPNVWDDPDE